MLILLRGVKGKEIKYVSIQHILWPKLIPPDYIGIYFLLRHFLSLLPDPLRLNNKSLTEFIHLSSCYFINECVRTLLFNARIQLQYWCDTSASLISFEFSFYGIRRQEIFHWISIMYIVLTVYENIISNCITNFFSGL